MTQINRRALLGLGLGVVALFGAGYAVQAYTASGSAGYEHRFMSVEEMKADGGLIVDIRTPPEWRETGVIDGAALLTFQNPDAFLAQIGPAIADGRDLILICRSGNRSSAAAEALAGRIPNRIISVAGGMKQEIAQGYQTVPPG